MPGSFSDDLLPRFAVTCVHKFTSRCICCCRQSSGDKKLPSSQGNKMSHSAESASRQSNDRLMPREQQCISRRHRPYSTAAMATAAAADDDTSSGGVENPGYNGHVPFGSFNGGTGSPPSTFSRELAQQSELVRDASIIREDSDPIRYRRGDKHPQRPGLKRFMSDMSDISNRTTSTTVSWAPSSISEEEFEERL